MSRFLVALLGLSAACLFASPILYSNSELTNVSFPDEYRQWTHVKTMEILKDHPLYDKFGGIHHIYANPLATASISKGCPNYKDGSVLVLDLLASETGKHAVTEGGRKFICVMKKNKGLFPDTGGWGFEAFEEKTRSRLVIDAETQCFVCHVQQKSSGYVFSSYRE